MLSSAKKDTYVTKWRPLQSNSYFCNTSLSHHVTNSLSSLMREYINVYRYNNHYNEYFSSIIYLYQHSTTLLHPYSKISSNANNTTKTKATSLWLLKSYCYIWRPLTYYNLSTNEFTRRINRVFFKSLQAHQYWEFKTKE